MNPPEFSVLLLAWNDADPGVAVLGGAALPPTQALVYQLAAQHPVLALYPHLPPADPETPEPPTSAAPPDAPTAAADAPAAAVSAPPEALETTAAPGPLETAVAMPGVRLLPALAPAVRLPASAATPPLTSRLVGLADLPPTSNDAPAPVAAAGAGTSGLAAPVAAAPAGRWASSPSQWPTGAHAPAPDAARHFARPAAPYLGASEREFFPPPPPVPRQVQPVAPGSAPGAPMPVPAVAPAMVATPAAALASAALVLRPTAHPQAGDLHFDPDPELPTMPQPGEQAEETEGIGPGEASDLSAPEDDLLLDAPAAAAPPEPVAAPAIAPAPAAGVVAAQPQSSAAPAPVVALPALDNLNFRMIQYARRAAQLMQARTDFGVIYAPNWPAWLAALEIRNSSRLPLVLYAATLAADFARPAERGWLLEVERMTLRRAHLVLVPDEAARRHLHGHYGELRAEVRIVPAHDEAAVQSALNELARPR